MYTIWSPVLEGDACLLDPTAGTHLLLQLGRSLPLSSPSLPAHHLGITHILGVLVRALLDTASQCHVVASPCLWHQFQMFQRSFRIHWSMHLTCSWPPYDLHLTCFKRVLHSNRLVCEYKSCLKWKKATQNRPVCCLLFFSSWKNAERVLLHCILKLRRTINFKPFTHKQGFN